MLETLEKVHHLEIINNIKSKIKGKIYVNDPYIKNFKENIQGLFSS